MRWCKYFDEKKEAAKEAAKIEQEVVQETADLAVEANEEAAKKIEKAFAKGGSLKINKARALQIKAFLEVLKDADEIKELNLGQFKDLEFSKSMTETRAKNIVAFLKQLNMANKIKPLGLEQFDAFGKFDVKDVIKMLDALKKANGVKIEFDFAKDTQAVLKEIATNTKATAGNTNDLPALLVLK